METNIKTLLESYGLDKKEIIIYLTLVEKGELNAYQIAKHTGIHRSTAYSVLERLLSKGFISEILKESKTFYSPLEISQIISKVKEKETILLSLIPELERLREEGISKVRVLESQKQFNYNLFDQITKGKIKELYIIDGGSSNPKEEELSSKIFLEKFLKELKKYKKIEYKGIWNEKFKETKLLKLFSSLGENKFLKNLPTQATTVIFGEYIAYLFTLNGKSQVIEIQNKLIAEENKAYFSYLWKQAKN
jgi:sugar-specific transcriptional regulator TrmB